MFLWSEQLPGGAHVGLVDNNSKLFCNFATLQLTFWSSENESESVLSLLKDYRFRPSTPKTKTHTKKDIDIETNDT